MRILHIGKYYSPYAGGMEVFLKDLLGAQKKMGLDVAALVHHHHGGKASSRETVAGVPIIRAAIWRKLLYAPISLSFPLVLRKTVQCFRPHLLHLHFPNPSAFWSLALSGARRIPWVIQWQSDVVPSNIDPRLKTAYRCYRPPERLMLNRARRILVASEPYLEQSIPLRPWIKKCVVVPLGIDPDRLPWPGDQASALAEKRWQPGRLRVLAVGRLTYYKGFDILIRAAARISGVTVQIVGEGDLRTELENEILKEGVADRVRLSGGLSDAALQAAFATCDLFCLPSLERTEAFGVVLLEAMRYGKPVIASDIPGSGPGWIVREGGCGWLVPPGDVTALSALMEKLAAAPDLLRSAGPTGRDHFKKTFHIKSVAARINDIYGDIYGDVVSPAGASGL